VSRLPELDRIKKGRSSCGRVPTAPPPPRGDFLGVKTCREAYMASGARSLRSCRRWRCDCLCRCCDPVCRRAEGEASVVGLLQCVGWLDPVGRHSDMSAAHKELHRFLSPREDLVVAAVKGL
jgi:hypothetical protein